ncbi:MAG: glycosyltransferase [Chitinophagaceae bacterium]|nr:glycosyltransferase [Chitinophagaceae bacterium]
MKLTVLIPAYNVEAYIAEAIRSVLAQTFTDYELLIIDDGSTDNTVAEIRKFNDHRIRLIEAPHEGFAATLNRGIREAKGYYIARFDADDICCPDRLKVQYDFMISHPEYILTGTDADYVDMKGEHIFTYTYKGYSDEEIRQLSPVVCPFSHTTIMYKKEEVIKAGGYNMHSPTFEDHLLWLNMIPMGKVCNIRQSLVKVRFNPESFTIDEKWRGKTWIKLKHKCLREGNATAAEAEVFRHIIRTQNTDKIKKASYYSLMAKKYLWDNYNPKKSRRFLKKWMGYYPVKPMPYLLYGMSFLPRNVVFFIYRNRPNSY